VLWKIYVFNVKMFFKYAFVRLEIFAENSFLVSVFIKVASLVTRENARACDREMIIV